MRRRIQIVLLLALALAARRAWRAGRRRSRARSRRSRRPVRDAPARLRRRRAVGPVAPPSRARQPGADARPAVDPRRGPAGRLVETATQVGVGPSSATCRASSTRSGHGRPPLRRPLARERDPAEPVRVRRPPPGPRSPLRAVPRTTTRASSGPDALDRARPAGAARAALRPDPPDRPPHRRRAGVRASQAAARRPPRGRRRRDLDRGHRRRPRHRRRAHHDTRRADRPHARAPMRPLLAVLDGRIDPSQVRARVSDARRQRRLAPARRLPDRAGTGPGGRPAVVLDDRPLAEGACVGVHQVPPRDEAPPEEPLNVDDTPLCRKFGPSASSTT